MTTTKAVAHRVGQARTLALRAQIAMTLTQLLLWPALIGAAVAVALWARRRLTGSAQETSASAPPTEVVTSDTSPNRLP